MTTVAIHQPAYLPWLGYLDRIRRSDVFVFLDTVQFEKNSFTNRNRIKTASGPAWLTVPVFGQGHTHSTLQHLRVDDSQAWAKKHLRSIELNYRRAPHFDGQFPRLAALYEDRHEGLADLCFRQLQFWLQEFCIATRVVRSSQLAVTERKERLVLGLCKALAAERYLSGPLGRDYLDPAAFQQEGIALEYHAFAHPVYPQLFGDFVPAMGIVDYWMNVGPGPLPHEETP